MAKAPAQCEAETLRKARTQARESGDRHDVIGIESVDEAQTEAQEQDCHDAAVHRRPLAPLLSSTNPADPSRPSRPDRRTLRERIRPGGPSRTRTWDHPVMSRLL